jgi:hypothetical protein
MHLAVVPLPSGGTVSPPRGSNNAAIPLLAGEFLPQVIETDFKVQTKNVLFAVRLYL